MSNADVAKNILDVVKKYEADEVGSFAVSEAVDLYEPLFEGLADSLRNQIHDLSLKVLEEDVSPQEEDALGIKNSKNANNQLKIILQNIINPV